MLGHTNLDRFFQRFVPPGAQGMTRIADYRKTAFAGSPEPVISIVNTASVSKIIQVAQKTFAAPIC
tara:strand:- start:724 stop:921 length:198 start_codon:yes stop_codon:yes gene_type:complete